MEKNYFVLYDINDNIIAYIDNIDELASYVKRRKRQLIYKFKFSDVVYVEDKNVIKVYKFS